MFCTQKSRNGTWYIFCRVMIFKSALILYPLRLFIAVKVAAPQFFQMLVFEPVPDHFTNSFRNQSVSPVRNTEPVADLSFCLRNILIGRFADHQTDTAYRLIRFLQNYGIGIRSTENAANNVPAVLNARMHCPAGNRANIRMAGIFV